ncbi:MAG: serine hydrolase [Erysipelotrichaceae bacterium]|nr:serine hydrolase [Erysipelotrichaceae bacterium]MDD3923518.1 serine hydrolase [Erysipelotrichaceae bacterium]
MDLKAHRNAFEFVTTLLDRKKELETTARFFPQKKQISKKSDLNAFIKAKPYEVGITHKQVYDYVNTLTDDKTTFLHTLMILKDDKLIFDLEVFPYQIDKWNYTFSMCKSITNLAIGLLVDEKKLCVDDHIIDIFDEEMSTFYKIRFKDMTIKHLLTMSTGVTFNELGSIAVNDWLRAFLSTNIKFQEGSEFDYNSMNSYILSIIVKKLTNENLSDYLKPRLFDPLNITNYIWEKCPMYNEKGGWGLYLSPIDMAKIGLLYLNLGKYDNKQIVSSNWVRESINFKQDVPTKFGAFDYGYHVWCKRDNDIFLLNGMFGQNVLVSPDKKMVIVTTAGNSDSFQTNAFFDHTFKFIDSLDNQIPNNDDKKYETLLIELKQKHADYNNILNNDTKTKFNLRTFIKDLLVKKDLNDHRWLDNKNYDIDIELNRRISILPLFIRGILNNHTKGLKSISFSLNNDLIKMIINEGDLTIELKLELNKPTYQIINFNGDNYECAILSQLVKDEDNNRVLKMTLYFTEYFSVRYVKLRFIGDVIKMELDEQPGLNYIYKALDKLDLHSKELKILQLFNNKLDLDLVKFRLVDILNPVVYGTLKKEEND